MTDAEGRGLMDRVERLGRAARLWRAAAGALAAVLLLVLLLWASSWLTLRDEATARAREAMTEAERARQGAAEMGRARLAAADEMLRRHAAEAQQRAMEAEARKRGAQAVTARVPDAPRRMPRADEP
jgi:hypothetical protein